MNKILTIIFLLSISSVISPKTDVASSSVPRPKLVVGIVVDQMRWDYLYRYYDRFGSGGFKRMLNGGFSCENTLMNHLPSVTGVGHAIVYSGAIPAVNGIAGNEWVEQFTGKSLYCTFDSTVQPVGAASAVDGRMSPRNLLVTTIGDELRMATNLESKVIAISLKDRASVLPGGHMANAAYWFDDASANFISSTYYMDSLPNWVIAFNKKRRVDALIEKGWSPIYPMNSYKASDPDTAWYEGLFPGEKNSGFPHNLKEIYTRTKSAFRNSPFGNTLTLEFVKEAMNAYQLGKGKSTDMLAINFASTDHAGHFFGVNSMEIEDVYLRLDKELAELFQLLDEKVGRGQWLSFLTADHGASHAVGYLKKNRIPSEYYQTRVMMDTLNKILEEKYKLRPLILSINNNQLNFDQQRILMMKLDYEGIKKTSVEFLQRYPGVMFAVDVSNIGLAPIPQKLKTMIINGYHFKRSGGVEYIMSPAWSSGGRTGTGHGSWYPYDTHIPLLWYGWNIKPGKLNRETYMSDIAPTLAAMLRVQVPNGSTGDVISEVMK